MQKYSNKDVAEKLNMKPSTIAYYTNRGFIQPDIADPKGKGTTRYYSKKNCVEILLINALTDAGIKLENVKSLLNFLYPYDKKENILNPDKAEPNKNWFITLYGQTGLSFDIMWYEWKADGEQKIWIDASRLSQIATIINISAFVNKVRNL